MKWSYYYDSPHSRSHRPLQLHYFFTQPWTLTYDLVLRTSRWATAPSVYRSKGHFVPNIIVRTHKRTARDPRTQCKRPISERSVIMHSSFTRSQHKDCCNLQIASEVDNSERCINRENIKLTYITRLSELTRLQMDLICTHINKLISLFTRKINTLAHYKYKYEHNNILLSILFICIYVRVATYLCVYGHTQQRQVWRLDDLCSRFAFLSRACHLPRHESGFSTMTMKCHAGWLKGPIYSVV